jgi:hypothetical protein
MCVAISRADPSRTAATENKIKKFFQKNRRKPQKGAERA